MPRYYGKLAKVSMVWGAAREGANFLIMLSTSVVLARLLSPREFGIAAAAYFFLQLASRLTQFGLGVSLVRVKELRRDHVSSVFVVNLLMGVSMWMVLVLCAPALGRFMRSTETATVLPTAAIGFLVLAIGTVPSALLTRDMRYRESTTSDWLAMTLGAGLTIGLAWRGFSYWSLVYGQIGTETVRAISRMWMARWWPSVRFSAAAMRELMSFGLGVYAKNLLDYAAQNLDNLVVGRVLGITALGFYDKAFTATWRFLARINNAGPTVSFRIFALIHDEPERFRRAYRKVVLSATLVGYPVLTGMVVTAPELISIMFGERWQPSVRPFQFLCVASMLKLLNTYASTATQAKGMVWSEVRRQALFTIVLVVAVAALCPWGIAGAAAGVLLATAFMTVLLQSLVKRLTGLAWRDLLVPQTPAIACSVGLVLVLLGTRQVLTHVFAAEQPLLLFLTCVTTGALYFIAFVLLSPFPGVVEVVDDTLHDFAPGVARRLVSARGGDKTATAAVPTGAREHVV